MEVRDVRLNDASGDAFIGGISANLLCLSSFKSRSSMRDMPFKGVLSVFWI